VAAFAFLCVQLRQYPFVHAWLTVKVLLLVLYIGLGTFALKRGHACALRIGCSLAAALVFALIITVARAHHLLGLFAGLPR
jgi:uncharacterized membrane protein SirB2